MVGTILAIRPFEIFTTASLIASVGQCRCTCSGKQLEPSRI